MLLGSDNNDNKLFGAEGGDTPKEDPNPSGFGSDKLFDNSGNNSINDSDDLVTDSFMLTMKANDPESVSEKLKDTAAAAEASAPLFNDNASPSSDNLFGDDDELSNFEFDSSISAFKPLSSVAPAVPAAEEPKAAAPAEEAKPFAEAPKTPEAPKADAKDAIPEPPLFIDDDPDLKALADSKPNEDPFKAGEDLDFAMSTNGNSNEFGAKDETKIPDPLDDLELDEEALAISPFKPKNAPVAESPKKEAPAQAKNEAAPAPAPAAETAPKAEEPKETKEATPSNLHTYGNVKSGVNAFGKKPEDAKAPSEAPKEAPKATAPVEATTPAPAPKEAPKEAPKPRAKSPFNKQSPAAKAAPEAKPKAEAPKEAPKPASKPEGRPAASHSPNTAPMPRPIPPTQRAPEKPAPAPVPPKAQPAAAAPKAQPAPQAQRTSAPQNAVVNQRPGMSAPEAKSEPSPFAPKGAAPATRPAANSRPAAKQPPKHSTTSNIQPVTPVTKNRKSEGGKKEKSKVGIIALIVAFLAIFLVVLGLENYDKIFPKAKPEETITETTPEATTATEETTTTEATTTTTEATTTETTTEATTEETTEETTTEETTVEETTTVEATTEATTTAASGSTGTSASYRYSIANPHSNGAEFSFDLVITDTGNAETNLTSSIEYLDITFDVDPDEIGITGISSDYYSFTQDANDPYTFHGTPTSGTVPAGGALNTTITCTTTEPVQHFYISTYHFQRR